MNSKHYQDLPVEMHPFVVSPNSCCTRKELKVKNNSENFEHTKPWIMEGNDEKPLTRWNPWGPGVSPVTRTFTVVGPRCIPLQFSSIKMVSNYNFLKTITLLEVVKNDMLIKKKTISLISDRIEWRKRIHVMWHTLTSPLSRTKVWLLL